IHAGSDICRLARYPGLGDAFALSFDLATTIISDQHDDVRRIVAGMVRDPSKIRTTSVSPLPTSYSSARKRLDVSSFTEATSDWLNDYPIPATIASQIADLNRKPYECHTSPTVGMYGKVGNSKGSFSLLRALTRIRSARVPLTFLSVPVGT